MEIIKIKDVYVKYEKKVILENINLNINKKQFLGIIGPNGGGKTTLLKVILGLIKPAHGKLVKDSNLSIGYVPQFVNFDKSFPITVLEVILISKLEKGFKLFKKYSKNDLLEADRIISKLGIEEYKYRQIGNLSGGQLQKVLIARALMNSPDVLILDEPTSNIDSKTRIEIFDLLKELNKDMTILIVSHDVNDIVLYVDSIACLNKKLHYHKISDVHLNKEDLRGKYSCPVKPYLKEKCDIDNCTCGGNMYG